MGQLSWRRLAAASVVVYVVVVAALTLLFGNPWIERVLYTDAVGQSPKVLAVWLEQEPLPAVTPWWGDLGDLSSRAVVVQGLLLVWAAAVAFLYAAGWAHRPGPAWRRGISFGLVVWAVVFLFFEVWVAFNLLGEPFGLMLVELALQLVAMLAAGVAVALVYRPTVTQRVADDDV